MSESKNYITELLQPYDKANPTLDIINKYYKYYDKQEKALEQMLNSQTSEDSDASFNLDEFAKEIDITLERDVMLEDSLSGKLDIVAKIIKSSGFEGELRQNFTIAHELAHLFLHSSKASNSNKYRKDYSPFKKDIRYSQEEQKEEEEADSFAANLLMPKELLKKLYDKRNKDLDISLVIKNLSYNFKVSKVAMANRLKALNIIPKYQWIVF